MFDHLYHDAIGLLHLIVSLLSLITGTLMLTLEKGTILHKRIGYCYVAAMSLVIITSFMMYRMFGGFGIFHVAALISFFTLLGGMVPFLFGKKKEWIEMHFSFMFWSVFGLYAAFASEILTRIPENPSFNHVGIATGAVMIVAGFSFKIYKKKWKKIFVA
jgi:uncharacterized membrane protein